MFGLFGLFGWKPRQKDELFEQGFRDHKAGLLPRMTASAYLRGYNDERLGGLDEIMQYFSTLDAYIAWKSKPYGSRKKQG